VLRRFEHRVKGSKLGLRLRPVARAVDRRLLRCVHSLLSKRVHRRVAEPEGS
jgi:hypothetical protein